MIFVYIVDDVHYTQWDGDFFMGYKFRLRSWTDQISWNVGVFETLRDVEQQIWFEMLAQQQCLSDYSDCIIIILCGWYVNVAVNVY